MMVAQLCNSWHKGMRAKTSHMYIDSTTMSNAQQSFQLYDKKHSNEPVQDNKYINNGVWRGRFEKAYLDVRVMNPLAPTSRNQGLLGMYKTHEQEKKRAYEQRVLEVHLSPPLHNKNHKTANTQKRAKSVMVQKCCTFTCTLNFMWEGYHVMFSWLRKS